MIVLMKLLGADQCVSGEKILSVMKKYAELENEGFYDGDGGYAERGSLSRLNIRFGEIVHNYDDWLNEQVNLALK